MSFKKFLFAGLGWAIAGPIGALIGYFVGSAIGGSNNPKIEGQTNGSSRKGRAYHDTGTSADIAVSLLVLIAAVMKADGVVRKSELDYVKRFLLKNYGEERAKEYLSILRDLVKQDIDLNSVCQQIKENTSYTTRYHLLDFLMGLAEADSQFDQSEERIILIIRGRLGIYASDYMSMRERHGMNTGGYSSRYDSGNKDHSSGYNNTYRPASSTKDPYKVLGLDASATDEEIKKAYRRFAMKYHPDKVEHLGEEMKRSAEAQFNEINEAYSTIKTARGFK